MPTTEGARVSGTRREKGQKQGRETYKMTYKVKARRIPIK
jgi:hypothetical protein